MISRLGAKTIDGVESFGDFCRFSGRALLSLVTSVRRPRNWSLVLPQMYEAGSRSLPVVMITGAFVGMVLAVQTVTQFRAIGMESGLGAVVNKSVLRELGPVLAGIMIAGRVGGGLTAELGTMNVTEQIDALRAMGTDPIRVLVVPRFIAAFLLTPLLTVYADFMGILGGYGVSRFVYGIAPQEFWRLAESTVGMWDVFYGIIKSFLFGGVMALVSCYKGFRCEPGAAGVGRACTQSFVATCMAILGINFLSGMLMNTIHTHLFGAQSWFRM
ncbi:MAG: MlaE family ABC transporter permease [Phycisphaerae bacterium]